jgi:hypothetical protein
VTLDPAFNTPMYDATSRQLESKAQFDREVAEYAFMDDSAAVMATPKPAPDPVDTMNALIASADADAAFSPAESSAATVDRFDAELIELSG